MPVSFCRIIQISIVVRSNMEPGPGGITLPATSLSVSLPGYYNDHVCMQVMHVF